MACARSLGQVTSLKSNEARVIAGPLKKARAGQQKSVRQMLTTLSVITFTTTIVFDSSLTIIHICRIGVEGNVDAVAEDESSSSKEFTPSATGLTVLQILAVAANIVWRPCLYLAKVFLRINDWITKQPRVIALGLLSLSVVWTFANPFDTDDFGDRNRANWLNVISSPFYGGFDRTGQKNITMVLINRDTLDYFRDPFWPPSYDAQTKLIEALVQYQPQAIFLDFYYTRPHHWPSPSKSQLNLRKNTGDPSPPAQLDSDDLAQFGILTADDTKSRQNNLDAYDCTELANKNVNTINDPSGIERLSRTMHCARRGKLDLPYSLTNRNTTDDFFAIDSSVPILHGPVSTHYSQLSPLQTSAGISVAGYPSVASLLVKPSDNIDYTTEHEGHLNAAFILYDIWCESSIGQSEKCIDDIAAKYPEDTPLNITWGYGKKKPPSATNIISYTDGCEYRKNYIPKQDKHLLWKKADSFKTDLFQSIIFLGDAFRYGFLDTDNRFQFSCLYHYAIPAHDILAGPRYNNGNKSRLQNPDAYDLKLDHSLKNLLNNKIVLVGADISSLADAFDTPLYGRTPGVAVHAMALDNLITNHQNASKQPRPGIGGADISDLSAFIFTLLAQLGILTVHSHKAEWFTSQGRRERLFIVYCTIITVAAGVIFGLGRFIMKWPSTDVLNALIILIGSATIIEWLDSNKVKTKPERAS